MGVFQDIEASFGKAYTLIKRGIEPLYIDLLKVNALTTMIGTLGLLVAITVFILLGGNIAAGDAKTGGNDSGLLMAGIAALIIMVLSGLVAGAAASVSYNVAENTDKGKPTTLIAQFGNNLPGVVGYILLTWGIALVIALPLLLSLFAGGVAGVAGACVFSIVSVVAFVLFAFFAQFGMIELVLGKKGPVAALKASFSVVKSNIIPVFALDIVLFVISLAIGTALTVIRQLLGLIPNMFSASGDWTGIALGYAIYFILLMIPTVLIQAASQMLTIPMTYYFWKMKKG